MLMPFYQRELFYQPGSRASSLKVHVYHSAAMPGKTALSIQANTNTHYNTADSVGRSMSSPIWMDLTTCCWGRVNTKDCSMWRADQSSTFLTCLLTVMWNIHQLKHQSNAMLLPFLRMFTYVFHSMIYSVHFFGGASVSASPSSAQWHNRLHDTTHTANELHARLHCRSPRPLLTLVHPHDTCAATTQRSCHISIPHPVWTSLRPK